MRVAGFGFRASAKAASLSAALELAGAEGVTMLAVVADKADAPALRALAETLGLPVRAVVAEDLVEGVTLSERQPSRYGVTSVAEGAALAAAGPGATLVVARVVSPDGLATVAIAEGAQT